jgi:hypothetical protein
MTTLHILDLQCYGPQDSGGRDEVSVQIDGVTVSGPHSMVDEEVIALSVLHPFTGSVAVNLIEEDPGVDNFIGTELVDDTLPDRSNTLALFHDNINDAHYHMKYHIHV